MILGFWPKLLNNSVILWKRPTSFQVVVKSNDISPGPPLHTEQAQFAQLLLITLIFFTNFIAVLCTCSCNSVSFQNSVQWGVVSPVLNTGGEFLPYACWLPYFWCKPGYHWNSWPLGNTSGSCSAGCWLVAPGPFLLGNFPVFPKHILLHGFVTNHVLMFNLVECHAIGQGPSIKTIQILFKDFLPSSRSTFPPTLIMSVNIVRMHSIPTSRSLIEMFQWNWLHPWAMEDAIGDQSPSGFYSFH